MENNLKKVAKSNVELFSEAVIDLKEHIDEVEPTGKYTARHPLVLKYETEYSLYHLSSEGADITDLERQFEEANSVYQRFREEHGQDYLTMLQRELEHLISGYPSLICYFMELDPYEVELQHDLGVRDSIEFLFANLEEEMNLQEEKLKVETLDDVFQCEYKRHLNEILETVGIDELTSLIEKPYYPPEFWWRHPRRFEE